MTNVARSIFVHGAAHAPTNPVDVLIAFGRVFGEIDP